MRSAFFLSSSDLYKKLNIFKAVFRIRIRIHRIHVFFGLPDSDLDPLARGMDPDSDQAMDPDPSIIMQK
jgi:hypothetical protein